MSSCEQITTPTFNGKCIVFTLVLATGYWYLPKRNVYVLISILYLSYLVLAWYDYIYDCQRRLGPTYLSTFYLPFKPPHSCQVEQYYKFSNYVKSRIFITDIVFAILLVTLWFMFMV